MKTLILGATGNLGSNITAALSEHGHESTCIIRPQSNRESIPSHENIKFIMNDLNQIEHELSSSNYDWVINSACVYRENQSLYQDMIDANLVFPLKVLNLAAKFGVRNFMTMGTCMPDNFNMYSFTKSQLAKFGRYISESEKRINFVELKLEMFYGKIPNGGGVKLLSGRFIQNMIQKLRAGENIKLTSGTQKRDIIHVEDIINIILRIMAMNVHGFMSLPVGTGENHSIREIVEFLHKETGSSSRLEFGALNQRNGEPDTLANTSWYSEAGIRLKYSFFGGLKHECINA